MKRPKANLTSNQNKIMELNMLRNNKYERIENNDDESEDTEEEHESSTNSSLQSQNLKKDYKNIALLMFLYLLQGLPLGLTGSLPYILSSRKVSYADQGTFSFAFWPFSMKLLWAPLVDSLFIKKFGRRKSWLIPVQYALGIFMILFSDYANHLIESNDSSNTNYSNKSLNIQIS